MKPLAVQLLVVTALAAVAGCDGASSTSFASNTPSAREPFIKQLKLPDDVGRDLGIENRFDFEFAPPPSTKHYLWIETYVKGRLVPEMTWGHMLKGVGADRGFTFQRYNPDVVSETKSKRGRWNCDFSTYRSYRWVDDPFKRQDYYGPSFFVEDGKSKPIKAGETYTALTITGESDHSFPGNDLEKWEREHHDVCVFVRIRFEPLAPGEKELENGSDGNSFKGLPDFTK